jgi:RND family efflux transporter MFP subunit
MVSKKSILIATVSTLLLSACSKEAQVESVEIVRPAKLIEIKATSNEKLFNFPAVVKALSSKDLTFQVSGQIESLDVTAGQEIKKGAVIGKLVQRDFINNVETAQNQYDSARIEFERAERLIAADAISRSVYDQRLTALNVASAQLDTAKKALEDTTLLSPFDGVIAAKPASDLQTISPSTVIVTIQTEGAAEALVKIPASLVSRSKQIEPLETLITLDAAPDVKMNAQFVSASAIADEQSQTFDVKFGFVPPESLVILPGMTGTISSRLVFTTDAATSGQISVPLSAIVTDSEGQFVWVVNPETMTVSKRKIDVGAGVGESLVVESGLEAGDIIVGAGASYLDEGLKIRRLEQ